MLGDRVKQDVPGAVNCQCEVVQGEFRFVRFFHFLQVKEIWVLLDPKEAGGTNVAMLQCSVIHSNLPCICFLKALW